MKGKPFKESLDLLKDSTTWKEAGLVAGGSMLAPIAGGLISGIVNKVSPIKVSPQGWGAKGMDLVGAAVVTGLGVAFFGANVGRYLGLGGLAGVVSDTANDTIVPALGLSDFLTEEDVNSGSMRDFFTEEDMLSDFATDDEVVDADVAGSYGEY